MATNNDDIVIHAAFIGGPTGEDPTLLIEGTIKQDDDTRPTFTYTEEEYDYVIDVFDRTMALMEDDGPEVPFATQLAKAIQENAIILDSIYDSIKGTH